MLTADYAITAAMAMLTAAGVSATVGVISLAAFNAKVRQWLEETSPHEEWIYEQRGKFRFYLLWAGVVATIVPLLIIVLARPVEIFWFQVAKGPPLSFGWSFLIVVALTGGTIAASVRLVLLAMKTGAALASGIRAQQVHRLLGSSAPFSGTVASSAESGEGPAAWTAEKSGGPIRSTEAAPSVDDPPSGGQGEGDD